MPGESARLPARSWALATSRCGPAPAFLTSQVKRHGFSDREAAHFPSTYSSTFVIPPASSAFTQTVTTGFVSVTPLAGRVIVTVGGVLSAEGDDAAAVE